MTEFFDGHVRIAEQVILSQRLVNKNILLQRLDHQVTLFSQITDTTENVRFAFVLTLVENIVNCTPGASAADSSTKDQSKSQLIRTAIEDKPAMNDYRVQIVLVCLAQLCHQTQQSHCTFWSFVVVPGCEVILSNTCSF